MRALRWSVPLFLGVALAVNAQQADLAAPPRRPSGSDSIGRARLEGQLRQRFAVLVRNRVGLSDDQMMRLRPVTQKYEQQRRQLQMEERDTRVSLRTSLQAGESADATQVDQMLQRMVDIQKRRVAILEAEQRDLATIMTPVQRARYMALQEQIRRRLEQMRQRRVP